MKNKAKIIFTTFFLCCLLVISGYVAVSTQAQANEEHTSPVPVELVNKIKTLVKTGALTPEEAAAELELLSDPELTGNSRFSKQSRTMKPQINYDSYVYNFEVGAHSGYEDNVYKHNFKSFPYVEAFVEHAGRRYFNPAALGISIRADYEKIEISNPNNHDVKVHFFLYKLTY